MGVVCGTHIFLFPLNKGNINFLTIFFATWFQWNDTLCGFWKINSVQFVWFGMLKGQKRNDISLYCWFSKENYCYPLFLSFTCLTHLSMNNFFLRNENRIFNRMPHKWFSLNGCRNNDELPNRTKIDSKVTSFTSFIAINQKEKCNNSVYVFQEKGNLPGNDVFTFCRSKKKKYNFIFPSIRILAKKKGSKNSMNAMFTYVVMQLFTCAAYEWPAVPRLLHHLHKSFSLSHSLFHCSYLLMRDLRSGSY